MTATETILKMESKVSFAFSLRDLKPFEHYKFRASGFPTTITQAKFYEKHICFSNFLLNNCDIEKIEKLLNKHNLTGDYRLTKSKTWARIQNGLDVSEALKLEFKF